MMAPLYPSHITVAATQLILLNLFISAFDTDPNNHPINLPKPTL